jgi:glycosyltransferase involved in cell wall biosynthesis
MSIPHVSVILPVYNDERFIARAIKSILDQTYTDFELIVVDDGSTDGTADVLKAINDSRLRVIYQANQGISAALNRAIVLSKGKYIARMDSDDIACPKRLALQVEFLDWHLDYGLVGSACEIVTENNQRIRMFRVPLTDRAIRRAMVWVNPIVHSSVMIRKSILDQVGYYDVRLSTIGHDYELWWRTLARSKAANLESNLITRVHRRNSTFRLNRSAHHFAMLQIQLRAFRFGWAPAIVVFSCARSVLLWLGYSIIEMASACLKRRPVI